MNFIVLDETLFSASSLLSLPEICYAFATNPVSNLNNRKVLTEPNHGPGPLRLITVDKPDVEAFVLSIAEFETYVKANNFATVAIYCPMGAYYLANYLPDFKIVSNEEFLYYLLATHGTRCLAYSQGSQTSLTAYYNQWLKNADLVDSRYVPTTPRLTAAVSSMMYDGIASSLPPGTIKPAFSFQPNSFTAYEPTVIIVQGSGIMEFLKDIWDTSPLTDNTMRKFASYMKLNFEESYALDFMNVRLPFFLLNAFYVAPTPIGNTNVGSLNLYGNFFRRLSDIPSLDVYDQVPDALLIKMIKESMNYYSYYSRGHLLPRLLLVPLSSGYLVELPTSPQLDRAFNFSIVKFEASSEIEEETYNSFMNLVNEIFLHTDLRLSPTTLSAGRNRS